jgi:hypothetical protein
MPITSKDASFEPVQARNYEALPTAAVKLTQFV